jgi:hypothetical protein
MLQNPTFQEVNHNRLEVSTRRDMSNTLKKSNPLVWLLDPLQPTADRSSDAYRFTGSATTWLLPAGIGIAALVMTLVSWVTDPEQFYISYLVGWTFCVSLALGGLFFVLIQHLTQAYWSVVIRRISEVLIWSFPMLFLLSIPLFFGMHDLYHWTHLELYDPSSASYDSILAGKQSYLNVPFFVGRIVAYFVIWSYLAYRLYTGSVRQDVDPDPSIPAKMRKISAVGLLLTSITTAFAGFDILMTLDPHWFSTIFGVYFFGGAFLNVMTFMVLVALLLRRNGMLKDAITTEHYQDLGKFIFGFIVFWAYISYSQYMLIWYANIPEETAFYRHRFEHGWGTFSAILLVGHFIIPFFALISRPAKRTLPVLGFMSVWILCMHWFDFIWVALPTATEHASLHLVNFTATIGLFGILFASVMYRLSRHSLVPENDPQLEKSLNFTNS